MHRPPASTGSPSTAATVIAALLPLPFHLVAVALLWAVMGGDALSGLFAAAGTPAWGVLGAATLTAVINSALLPLSVRFRAVPAALPLLFALTPWLTGAAGVVLGMQMVESAVAHVNPEDKGIILAVGLSEALGCAVLGGWLAAPQLGAVALGLGMGSVGQRAPGRQRRWAVTGVAALVALPLLIPLLRLGGMGTGVALLAGVAAVALVLAGLGLGRDADGRSATLALVAAVAGAASVGAAGAVGLSSWLGHGLEALAHVSPVDRATILTAVLADFLDAQAGLVLALFALGAAVAVMAVGASRLSSKRPRVLGALALSVVAALGVGAVERAALLRSMRSLGTHLGGGSMVAAGLEPLVFKEGKTGWAPGLVVHADSRLEWAPSAAYLELELNAEGVARLLEEQGRQVEQMRSLREMAGDVESPLLEGGEVVIAVDRRADGAALLNAVRLAQAGGATHVGLHGELEPAPPMEDHARVIEAFPFVAALAKQEAILRVMLPAGIDEAAPSWVDANRWRAPVEKDRPLRISPREGSDEAPFLLGQAEAEPVARRSEGELVHLEVDWALVDAVTLAGWIGRLEGAGYRPVLHPEGLPELRPDAWVDDGAR